MKRKEPENVVQEQDERSGDDSRDGGERRYAFSDSGGDSGDDSRDGGERRYAFSDSGGDSGGDGGESDLPSGSDDGNDGSITVRIDSQDLDCPVCLEPLHLPLFQCTNGHIICSRCCRKVSRKCPTCTLPLSRRQCLPFESIIKSNEISCSYSRFGCKLCMTYAQRHAHKESCLYAPCFCPIPACRFRGDMNAFIFHLDFKHPSFEQREFFSYGNSVKVSLEREQPFFFLQTACDLSFLLLNSHGIHSGNELSVVCIRPGPSSCDFQYELEVAGDVGKKLRLDAPPENVRKWTKDYRAKFFLYVPDDFTGSSGVINVKVCIRKLSNVSRDWW